MTERLLIWAWHRFRPAEGWLPLFLLATMAVVLVLALEETYWVGGSTLGRWTALTGFVLVVVLATRPWRWFWCWGWLALALLFVTYIAVSQTDLWRLLGGWSSFIDHANWRYLVFRLSLLRWLAAMLGGATSRDPLALMFLLTLGTGWLTAVMAWMTYRVRRPLGVLLAVGLLLAWGSYAGQSSPGYVVLFMGLAIFHTAVWHYSLAVETWETNHIDYSGEIRISTWLWGGGMALGLTVLALVVPSLPVTAVAYAFQASAPVQAVETELERVFGEGRAPDRQERAPAATSGVFPRDFLLGQSPELSNTAVFIARTSPAQAAYPYWRGQNYDVYTGRGWLISAEAEQAVPAFAPVLTATVRLTVTQVLTWQGASPLKLLYVQGWPQVIDLPTKRLTHTAVAGDFSRLMAGVLADPRRVYTAVSSVPLAPADELRAAQLAAVPPDLLAHYTALPDELPSRVPALAREITTGLTNPYEQALALEQFLRQYDYDLNVPLPPANVDPVDYFLFELQRGYCDYYASAMVVLARSLGLPARLGIGYRAPAPEADGTQVVRQKNGHSWVEIYFAGQGWIAFEPTAVYPRPPDVTNPALGLDDAPTPSAQNQGLPLPPRAEAELVWQPWYVRRGVWLAVLLVWLAMLVVSTAVWYKWDRRWRPDEIARRYAQLQRAATKLDEAPLASQTPAEFGTRLQASLPAGVSTAVGQLVALYAVYLYAPPATPDDQTAANEQAHALWRTLRWPLWQAWLRRQWARLRGEPSDTEAKEEGNP